MDDFAERFNMILKEKKITQSELSKMTGITPSSISDWLRGKYIPKQDKVYVLSKALKVSPTYLLGYDEINKNFSENLTYYMELHNLNNRKLGEKIDVSESTVGKWLLMKSTPRMNVIEKLANLFEITTSDLIESNINRDEKKECTNISGAINNRGIFSKNLSKYIEDKGLTPTEFARVMGYPETTVFNWIHKKTYPRVDRIQEIADYFNINKSDLTENKKTQSNLDSLELELLNNYKKSNEQGKQIILDTSRNISKAYPIISRQELIDYLEELPLSVHDGKINIHAATDEELYNLYKIIMKIMTNE